MMAEKRMTFFEHLEELRRRIVVIAAAVLIGAVVAYYFAPEILHLMKVRLPQFKLTFRSPLEPFMAKVKLSMIGGIILALPVLFYETLAFLSPALKGKERRVLYPLVFFLVVLFALGASLGYFYVMPLGVKWLLAQAEDFKGVYALINITDFINFVTLFLLAFGVAFETPLVMFILIRLGVVSRQTMRKNWRVAYVTIMLVAAIATPDWSLPPMIILSISMIALYEMTLLLVRR